MRFLFSICLLPIIITMTTAQTPSVQYRLGMSRPWTHFFEVEVGHNRLPKSQRTLDLILPTWRSGRYLILDFAGSVQEFSAFDGDGKPLSWEKIDKTTWRIQTNGRSAVTARYKVYANEFSLRTKGLNDEGAFLDGSSVFMYSETSRRLPLTLTVVPYKNWHVTTGLEEAGNDPFTFTSPDYDYLVDCPLFVGTQKDFEFQEGGKNHVLSIMGEGNYDSDRIIDDLRKIILVNKKFWGLLPYEKYVFMLHLTPQGGGGTEHINSTIMGARPFIFDNPGSYQSFLGLVSHEYFHTWNVKQIRPRGISPYDWTKENYTKELWVAEGTTSYYGAILMVRAGFMSAGKYIERLPNQIQGERQRPGNRIQSVTESSFDAWVKFWKGNEHSYNSESDYYDRGSDLSLALDLEIRQRSQNRYSLDDVMRALFERFPWNGKGYTVADLQKICEEYGGNSFQLFFDRYIFGTQSPEWEKLLSYAGLTVKAVKDGKAWLGLFVRDQGEQTTIRFLMADSPAYDAGLNVNDELVAINGRRVRANNLSLFIGEMKIGDTVKITVMRNDRLREFNVTLGANPVSNYTVRKTDNPSELQKSIFESWLATSWDHDSSE